MIVVVFDELELGGIVSVGVERERLSERPPRERAGRRLDVVLRVVAHAHGEQLEQLAPVVFVDLVFVVLVVVEPEDHRRVARQLQQDGSHVRHAHAPEHVDLRVHGMSVFALAPRHREHVVQEQRHFLFERPRGVRHSVQPLADVDGDGLAAVVPLDVRGIERLEPLRVDEVVHYFLIGLLAGERVQLRRRRPEARAPHQMRRKRPIRFHLSQSSARCLR